MIRILPCCAALAAAGLLSSASAAENLVRNGGFEASDPTEGWMIPSGWKVEEKAGPDGSRALVWENADPNRYTFPIYGVDYEPGAVYRFGVKMRADRLETGKPYVNLEWSSTNRVWLGNCESTVVRDNDVSLGDGWVRYEGRSAPMPPDVGRGSIVCFLPKGSTGRIRVDDFFIEKEAVEPVASFVSSAYRDEVVSGKVRFFAALNLNPRRHPVADCAAELGYAAADGTRKTVRADRFTASEAHFELDASAFAEGPQTLGFRVRHLPTGTTVGGRKLAFSRVKAPTARRVSVDGGRRLTVDGKRYFPLGLYVGKMTEADFVEYNRGPFNSAVRYGNIYPSEMDAFHRHGIMVSPDLRGFASVMDLKRDEGELKAKIEAKVREIGSHPALLTWYVIDEAPPAFIGRLSRATAWLHAADPDHPTFAVLDKPHHVRAFLPAYDIVAIDTYPIGYNGGADVSKVAARIWTVDEAMFGYRDMWMIPQAFNWAWYRKGEDLKKPNLRMPTREEMANMAWQSVAAGANGLCFYSFKDLRSHLSGADFDREWAKVCDVGREIKGVEAVLLSDDDPTAAEGWDRGKLAVRVFAQGGRRWILAANRSGGPVRTTFRMKGVRSLRPLVGGGLTAADGQVTVGFAPLGYALAEVQPEAGVTYDVAEGTVAQTVAKDLKAYLARRTSGGVFTIGGQAPVIHVGDTAFAKAKGLLSDGMKDEEWVIRSFGGDLVLNGRGRGLTLAVGNFFDDDCGIRFWSEYEEYVPSGDLRLGALDRRGRPAFLRRDVYTTPQGRPHEGRFGAYTGLNRCDGSYGPVARSGSGGGCHTFAAYMPSDRFFKDHPDWFMMDKQGHRTVQQPCLTHPEVRAHFKRQLRAYIEKDRAACAKDGRPAPRIYDISQNDHQVYCECPACAAVIAKKGCSGLMLDFVNDIAASVKDDWPDVRVMTFAYVWTKEPPLDGTQAADNVIVRFCNTESNLAGSIRDADNTWLLKTLRGWSAHAKELFVWDYAVTYSKGSLGFPMPGEFGFGDLFRAYRQYGVKSIFMEHEQQHRSDMWELKYRLETKLMQDPDADADAIIADFMEKYYGPAGDKVLAYRKYLWRTRRANKGFVCWIPSGDFDYIHADNLAECNRLMDEAEAAVAHDATYLARVRRARVGLDLLTVQRERIAGRGEGALAQRAIARVNGDWAKWIARYPDKDGSWKRLELMMAVGLPTPPQFRGRHVVDFPAVLIKDPEPEAGGDTVDDPTSPVGIARRLSWDYKQDEHLAFPFTAGMYDALTKRATVAKSFDRPIGEGWNWYHVGVGRTTAKTTFWMTRSWQIWVASSRFVETWDKDWDMWVSAKFTGPKYGFPSADGKSHVWIDRMILVEPQSGDKTDKE